MFESIVTVLRHRGRTGRALPGDGVSHGAGREARWLAVIPRDSPTASMAMTTKPMKMFRRCHARTAISCLALQH